MKLLGLSGSLNAVSKTQMAVEKALSFASEASTDVEVELVSLQEYKPVYCDGRDPSLYEGETRELIDKIEAADALIIGSPIYRGSMSGALKNVFDLIPNDALEGKVLGFVATGGTYHHYLAIEHQLKPLAGYFKAHVVPVNVYAHNQHYSHKQLTDEGVISRLKELALSVVLLHERIRGIGTGAAHPDIPRVTLTEEDE